MEIKTYAELVSPDERNTIMGFMEARVDGGFDIEIATEVVQSYVSYIDLQPGVPDVLLASYDRVRKVFTYGLFDYELFTVAGDQATLLLEQALRVRFVTLYNGLINLFSRRTEQVDQLNVKDFEEVVNALNRGGSHVRGNWTVTLRSGRHLSLPDPDGKEGPFKGTLSQLQTWARQERLLSG